MDGDVVGWGCRWMVENFVGDRFGWESQLSLKK